MVNLSNLHRIGKQTTFLIVKCSISIFAVSVIFTVIYIFIHAIDSDFDSGYLKPYRQTYCLNDTEYTLSNITQDEFVERLESLIRADTTASYAYDRSGKLDSMNVGLSVLGFNKALGQGPLCYTVSFFVPFDKSEQQLDHRIINDFSTNDKDFDHYPGKYKLVIKIIDTEPLKLLLPRGVGFGYYSSINYVNQYFRHNYLDKICGYDKQIIKNFLFSAVNWGLISIHYTYSLLAIAAIWLIIWLIMNLVWKIYCILRA